MEQRLLHVRCQSTIYSTIPCFQLENKLEKYQEDFEAISKVIRKEMVRFEKQRVKDFKSTIIHYLESLMNSQQQVRHFTFVNFLGLAREAALRVTCLSSCEKWTSSPAHLTSTNSAQIVKPNLTPVCAGFPLTQQKLGVSSWMREGPNGAMQRSSSWKTPHWWMDSYSGAPPPPHDT